jgi:Fe2+ or Zn2+ uptake regulation protein
MKQQRTTRQLAAVYDALAASHDHPTADEIFRRVRDALPRVSLGTVYRNLDKLREQGRLRVVRLEGIPRWMLLESGVRRRRIRRG